MPHRLPNYLRAHRKRWDLTQEELAFLLGLAEQGTVSHIELHGRIPSSSVVAASQRHHAGKGFLESETGPVLAIFFGEVEYRVHGVCPFLSCENI
jgi:transcriptional regulator with XRE-family HTH domain